MARLHSEALRRDSNVVTAMTHCPPLSAGLFVFFLSSGQWPFTNSYGSDNPQRKYDTGEQSLQNHIHIQPPGASDLVSSKLSEMTRNPAW